MTIVNQITNQTISVGPDPVQNVNPIPALVEHNPLLFEVFQGRATLQQTPGKMAGIQVVQSYLKTLGYSLKVTGSFDNETRQAVETFQRRQGYSATGSIDKTTLVEMNQAIQDVENGEKKVERYIKEFNIAQATHLQVKIFPNLEHGSLQEIKAIVLHRTDSPSAQATLNGYRTQSNGAHYLIDIDGTIYQTAGLDKKTQHVGEIKSHCYAQSTCSESDTILLRSYNTLTPREKKAAIHDLEKRKIYPQRYPMNEDSIGIEVVGRYDKQNETYLPATPEQLLAIDKLIEAIMQNFDLKSNDVFPHGLIASKKETEGYFLGH